MGGIALLARARGHRVSGCDRQGYPPMSELLLAQGITPQVGYDPAGWRQPPPDLVIVGNALSRGNPSVEYLLDSGLPYVSGPQWLAEQVLPGYRCVLVVAGTHGKTTTSAMLAWILECAGLAPGFLVGGVAPNFGVSARLGGGQCFVVEGDEYDTAFFDKRSKFIHYRPHVLILHPVEFDHADIFDDIAAIRRQFHHLVRVVPAGGRIFAHHGDDEINRILAQGCWTPVESFGAGAAGWTPVALEAAWQRLQILHDGQVAAELAWNLAGSHNAHNALAAIAAAAHVGVEPAAACRALASFRPVRRRLERLAAIGGVEVYDDFAHHPTAIRLTLQTLRALVGQRRILAALELASNTMRRGTHRDRLAAALDEADRVWLLPPPELAWSLEAATRALAERRRVCHDAGDIATGLAQQARPGDVIVMMSNGAFGGLQQQLIEELKRAQ